MTAGAHPPQPSQIPVYEIRVEGRLVGELWAARFEGLSLVATSGGSTVLRGPVQDQAALRGLLVRLCDLAIPLVSVRRLPTGPGLVQAAEGES